MKVDLDYGRGVLSVDLPDGNVADILQSKEVPHLVDVAAASREALAAPVESAPLQEIARGKRTACIVIPDKTRPLPNALVLPPILAAIEETGVAKDDILILIATGLHRPNEGEELIELVGEEIAGAYRCENHVARDLAAHADLGVTTQGVPIWIDRRYVGADLKVLVGLVEPHFFAGYSGGRKMVCPGIAAAETILPFHSPPLLEDPRAAAGVLDGNPVHEISMEVARTAGVDFTFNVAIDATRRPVAVFAGSLEATHEAAAAFVADFASVALPESVPIAIASCGGYPLDDTFYQAVKGMMAPMPILQDDGTVIAVARIEEGIGSEEYTRLMMETADWREFHEWIMDPTHFVIDQWELEMQIKILRRAEIVMVSEGLTDDVLRACFVTPASSVEAAVEYALAKHGRDARIAVLPQGPYVIPTLDDSVR